MLFIRLKFFSTDSLWSFFNKEWMLKFVKNCFLFIYWDDNMIFLLLICWITLISLKILNLPWIAEVSSTWSRRIIFYM